MAAPAVDIDEPSGRQWTQTYLILGDGDFTFSLDLARYLRDKQLRKEEAAPPVQHRIRLVATGLDALSELTDKYRDTPFILKSLAQCSVAEDDLLRVDINHGVNAVAADATTVDDDHRRLPRADHVIFNHPHLGNEDCVRHSQFLLHLFHACQERWLAAPHGRLHLTLADGQWERWKCFEAADRQGLALVERLPFQSPPTSKTYYQVRRHQTGKSFRNRTTGPSETFTFMRRVEMDSKSVDPVSIRLPWYSEMPSSATQKQPTNTVSAPYVCQFCERTFREERSLNSHMLAKHVGDDDDDNDNNLQQRRKRPALTCPQCPVDSRRSFTSEEALAEHVQAKHSGPHTTIVPDWSAAAAAAAAATCAVQESSNETIAKATFGKCAICDKAFYSETDLLEHEAELVPLVPNAFEPAAEALHACSYCGREFREKRARLQHENNCAQHHATATATGEA